MIVEIGVDYIQYNCIKYPSLLEKVPPQKSNIRNYEYMYICPTTGTRIYHGNKKTNRYHVIMSASSLVKLPVTVGEWITFEVEDGSFFTRVDIALTQYIDEDGLITRDDIRHWYRKGLIRHRWSKDKDCVCQSIVKDFTERDGNGSRSRFETTYIGNWNKRAKNGIFRAYDKGVEMDLDPYLISRFEIETKRKTAQVDARNISRGKGLQSIFRSRFDVDDKRWNALFDEEPLDLSSIKHDGSSVKTDEDMKRINRWSWLVEQCAPSLGKQLAYDTQYLGTQENYRIFQAAVMKAYEEELHRLNDLT